jgi:DNA-binding NtrC family response regulator
MAPPLLGKESQIGRKGAIMQTILIVSRCEREVARLSDALNRTGFSVTVVGSAEAARRHLEFTPVALTVIDIDLKRLPGGNGLDLARDLRSAYPGMRVALTGGCHLSERQLERTDSGACGFLPKPFGLDEAVAFIREKVDAPPSSSRRLWHAQSAQLSF